MYGRHPSLSYKRNKDCTYDIKLLTAIPTKDHSYKVCVIGGFDLIQYISQYIHVNRVDEASYLALVKRGTGWIVSDTNDTGLKCGRFGSDLKTEQVQK